MTRHKTISIDYAAAHGPSTLECSVPSSYDVTIHGPAWPETSLSTAKMRDILSIPGGIDTETLVIVNDLDRPTPTDTVFRALSDRYPDILSCDVLVATGAHKITGDPDAVKRAILGDIADSHTGGFHIHNCWDDPMMRVGATRRGTEVIVSGWLFSYDRIVAIGSVEPHWFAGYTGGRKSLIPGVAAYETIRQNHSLASLPESRHMKTSGNPLHEDLLDATLLVIDAHKKKGGASIVGINAVSHADDIYALAAAPILESIEPLYGMVDTIYTARADTADIVIALAEAPMDRDLYQAMKSFENVLPVMKPGGVYLLVAASPDGVGPPHFSRTLSLGDDFSDLEKHLAGDYILGNHKFINPLEFTKNGGLLLVCSETLASLPGDSTALGFFRANASFPDAIDAAISHVRADVSKQPRILIVRDAVNTVLTP